MWQIKEEALPELAIGVHESLYTLGNGYLGIRGFFEEWISPSDDSIRGTYLNGVYDRVPMEFGERAVGFPELVDKQPRVMETQTVTIRLDGEVVRLNEKQINNYERVLDFKKGSLLKSYDFITLEGKQAHIVSEKLISFKHQHLCLTKWTIDYEGSIEMDYHLSADVRNYANENDPRVAQGHSDLLKTKVLSENTNGLSKTCHCLIMDTKNSGLSIGAAQWIKPLHRLEDLESDHDQVSPQTSVTVTKDDKKIVSTYTTENQLSVELYAYFTDSRLEEVTVSSMTESVRRLSELGWDAIQREQEAYLEEYWKFSDIQVKGNESLQQALRFKLFHLLQSVGKDGKSNISAKGLSGEGYEGHYFWDTEIYVLPLLSINQPNLAKKLLEFRSSQLPQALEEARKMGHEHGAKFPWRTISGIECSGYFPAGTAQYHINADIAYGVIQYVNVSGDHAFLYEQGLELLVETSRFWLNVGQWLEDSFKINCVTGPDEYTALVDNNFYTNGMAQHQLQWTAKYLKTLLVQAPEVYATLSERLNLKEEEIAEFERAARAMYLPRNFEKGIDLQDDQFMNRAPWPFDSVSEDHYPLLLHYHPLIIYRHQVLKQADTVLAHLMLPQISNLETMRQSFDFYEELTTHDSSLSSCVYGTMAARLGLREKAWKYFMESVNIDLKNTHGNTKDGLHMANLAGSCLTVLKGFAGLTLDEQGIHLNPWVPEQLQGYSFKVAYQGALLEVEVSNEETKLHFLSDVKAPVSLYGSSVTHL